MQPRQSENVDGNDLLPIGASDINKRVGQFRSRKASKGLERLEIYTSRLVKDQVKEFALVNQLTRGVAAEVLLQRGIAAYISEKQRAAVSGRLNAPPLPVTTDAARSIVDDSIPELARLFRERAMPDRPQRLAMTPLDSDSLVAPQTQTAPKPADSMSSPEVIGPPENLMAQCIRDGQPQPWRKARTQTTPEQAESKPFQKVMEPKVNSMAQWIREGSPQRIAETVKDRLKTETKG